MSIMIFDAAIRNRLVIWLVAAIVVCAAVLGTTHLKISTDNRIFYGSSNPYFQDYLQFENQFTSNDNILFALVAPFPITEDASFPAAIRWLTTEAAALNHVIRVDSLSNYPHPYTKDDTLVVEPLLDWACPDGKPCTPELLRVVKDTHLVNRLSNESGTAAGVIATVSLERGAVGEIEGLNRQATELADRFKDKYPEFDVYLTGGVPMMAAFAQATAEDLGALLPAALLIISILLILVLGSIRLALVIIAVGLASIVTTLGLAGWAGCILNNATSIVPLIVFTLVVTASMHIAVHFARNIGSESSRDSSLAQARASFSSSLIPLTISAATSAVSLCSLWFVDSPPLRQLGLLSAVGVAVGFLFTITLLPSLLVSCRYVAATGLGALAQGIINAYAKRQEAGNDRIAIPATLLALSAAGLAVLEVNDDFVRFFEESVPFRVDTDRATEVLAGPNHIEVVVTNPNGTAFEPQVLSHLARLAAKTRGQDLVANVHSFSDIMNTVAQAFTGHDPATEASEAGLAQLFLIYELSLQFGQSNRDMLNVSQDSARMSVLLKESTSNEIKQLEGLLYDWHAAQGSGLSMTVTGENIPVAHLSLMNIRSMITGIFLSLAFTSAVIGITFQSFRLGLVALVSTVAPVVAGFGAWGWVHQEIGLAATAIIALTIGVVVDDAAHYIYRFLDARNRLNMSPRASAAYATHRAGAAIAGTSIVMGLGLSMLLLSNFEVNSSFGAVACLIIAMALIFNLSILPRLTIWAESFQRLIGATK